MFNIQTFLERFKKITPPDAELRTHLSRAIKEVVGVDVAEVNIQIKNNIANLKIKPLYKSEIFIKKEKILAMMEKEIGKKILNDIR